jgi:isopentenyl diphosphate isomerase/L-lactate dehydrogenase-like FMN-dependent dehydrogenase
MIGKLIERGDEILREKHIDFVGRAETGHAVKFARDHMDSLMLEIRMIDSGAASTDMSLFGEQFSSPIMTAPLSGLGGVWPNGLVETAKGAAMANVAMWVGIGGEQELSDVIATGAKTIKIIKPYADHDLVIEKIRQAEKYGAIAVGMDTLFGVGAKKGDTVIMPKPFSPKSANDLGEFIKSTNLPFVVKGVLSAQDAVKAAEAGAAAIVVSGHSGSVLDYSVPPLKILPTIVAAIGHKIPCFVDGGFARGTDAFKALALGADGVLVGRALIRALAVGGAETAFEYLTGVTEELRRVMALTGSPSVGRIDPSVIWES